MTKYMAIFAAAAFASSAYATRAGPVITTSGDDTLVYGNIIADTTGTAETSKDYAIAVRANHGLINGIGLDGTPTLISAVGDYSESALNGPTDAYQGATGVYFRFTTSANPLENIGTIRSNVTINATAIDGKAMGMVFQNANQAEGAAIAAAISAEARGPSRNTANDAYAYGIYATGSRLGDITGSVSATAANTAAYGVYLAGSSSIGTVSGKISAETDDKNAFALDIRSGGSAKAIAGGADISAATKSGAATALRLQGATIGDAGGLGNISGKISAHSQSSDAVNAVHMLAGSQAGDIGAAAQIYAESQSASATALRMQGGAKLGNIAGSVTAKGSGNGVAAIKAYEANTQVGDIAESAVVSGISETASGVPGQAYGIYVYDSARLGNVAGTVRARSANDHAYGIAVSQYANMGDILSTANISAKSSTDYATGIMISGGDQGTPSKPGSIGTVYGNVHAETDTSTELGDGFVTFAAGIHSSNIAAQTVRLGGNASVSAKNNDAGYSDAAFAIASSGGSLTIVGDGTGTHTLTGGLSAAGALVLSSGNFILSNYAASSTWKAVKVLRSGTDGSVSGYEYFNIDIAADAHADLGKSVRVTAENFNLDGTLSLYADTLADTMTITLADGLDGHMTSMSYGAGSRLDVILSSAFEAFAGDTLDLVIGGETVSGSFENAISLRYADGTEVGRNLYAFDGRTVEFLGHVPEPAAWGATLGAFALAAAAYLRRKSSGENPNA